MENGARAPVRLGRPMSSIAATAALADRVLQLVLAQGLNRIRRSAVPQLWATPLPGLTLHEPDVIDELSADGDQEIDDVTMATVDVMHLLR